MNFNQNEFLPNLINLVIVTKINRTINGDRINDLLNSVFVDPVEYGDGELFISVDTLATKDYSENSTLLQTNKPTIDEQYLSTTDKKYVTVTLNKYLMKGAFANEYSLADCIAVIEGMLEKTKNIYCYKKTITALEGWTPTKDGQAVNEGSQVVEIELINTANMTGQTLVETEKANALKIYTTIRNVALNVQAPSRKYNELQFEEMFNADELNLYINAKFDTQINTYAYASLLNSEKLNNIEQYKKSIIIPTEQFKQENQATLIGWLASDKKYIIAPRLVLATSFFDGSNLKLNHFLHFWLISGFRNGLAMVKFTAKYVAPPATK